jgi:hypothetical protein
MRRKGEGIRHWHLFVIWQEFGASAWRLFLLLYQYHMLYFIVLNG